MHIARALDLERKEAAQPRSCVCVLIAPIDPVVVTRSFASQLFRFSSFLSGAAVHTPVCVCVCVCVFVCVCVRACLCVCVFCEFISVV
jgi:hypothetical protein